MSLAVRIAKQWLEEMTHQIPLISGMTLQNFSEISELLHRGRRLESTESEYEKAILRALEKKAPFHRERNSVADALLDRALQRRGRPQ